jgi:hypothetical protein
LLEFSSVDSSAELEFVAIHSQLSALIAFVQFYRMGILNQVSRDSLYVRLFEFVHFEFLSLDSLQEFIQLITMDFEYVPRSI